MFETNEVACCCPAKQGVAHRHIWYVVICPIDSIENPSSMVASRSVAVALQLSLIASYSAVSWLGGRGLHSVDHRTEDVWVEVRVIRTSAQNAKTS